MAHEGQLSGGTVADWDFLSRKDELGMGTWRRAMAKAKRPVPEGYHTVTPVLTLDDTAKAIDWYKKAFGAEEIARSAGPDGRSCTPRSRSATRES